MKYPKIILITAFGGRRFCLDKYFKGIRNLDYPKDKISLVFSDGSNDKTLKKELDNFAKDYPYYTYNKDTRKPMTGITAGSVEKSKRIASVYTRLQDKVSEVSGDYILSAEDDIVPPTNGLNKLLKTIKSDEKIGCVFGRQICRWMDLPMAWKIKKRSSYVIGGKENKYDCKPYPLRDSGLQEVDGMPMGFNLFSRDIFLKADIRAQITGLTGFDLILAQDIKNWGYKVIIDWSIHCKHYHDLRVRSKYGSFQIQKMLT